MTKQTGPISVIGGVNVDICGTAFEPLIEGDSNPGRVTVSLGGVGRNIADNIARLQKPVRLISVLGEDAHGIQAEESCRKLGIDMSLSRRIAGETTSTYLCINDSDGDVRLAIAAMDICRHISPMFLLNHIEEINRSSLVVVDANLSEEAITCLCEHCTVPIFADPVSVRKAVRLKNQLGKLYCVKPNRPEAEILTGVAIRGKFNLEKAAGVLLDKGVQRVFISLGGEGVYFDDGVKRGIIPCYPGHILDTTGCGDAFMAAAASAFYEGAAIEGMARMGLAIAALCAGVRGAIRTDLSRQLLEEKIQEVGGAVL